MSDIKHTPLPWALITKDNQCNITSKVNDVVTFYEHEGHYFGNEDADCEFIVRACNSHYELVKMLKGVKKCLKSPQAESFNRMFPALLDCVEHTLNKAKGLGDDK